MALNLQQLYADTYRDTMVKLAAAFQQAQAMTSRAGGSRLKGDESSFNPDTSQTGTSDDNPATPGRPGQGKRPAVTDEFVMGVLAPKAARQPNRPLK